MQDQTFRVNNEKPETWLPSNYETTVLAETLVRTHSEVKTIYKVLVNEDKSRFECELLTNEIINSCLIENITLNIDAIIHVVSKKLGVRSYGRISVSALESHITTLSHQTVINRNKPLTKELLINWRNSFDPIKNGDDNISVINGLFLKPDSYDRLTFFLKWFNSTSSEPSLVRAALAVFRYSLIDPDEVSNNYIGRMIGDIAIAQIETHNVRLLSISETLQNDSVLMGLYSKTLKGCLLGDESLDNWINTFLKVVNTASKNTLTLINKYQKRANFRTRLNDIKLNFRQQDFLEDFLAAQDPFEMDITYKVYAEIVHNGAIATLKRDIKDMLIKKVIVSNGAGGRSSSYKLNHKISIG
jgi:hypothetical protein